MKNAALIIQILVSLLVIIFILLQARGTGLGTTFGGSNEQYRSKRGFEQLLFRATILLICLFFITSVISLFV